MTSTSLDQRYKADSETGCWHWTGRTDPKGYGRLGHQLAHRLVYAALVGPIPSRLTLDHLCRVRHCVNPAHLEPVTIGENVRRGNTFQGINARKTHCVHGHALTDDNVTLINTGHGRVGRRCLTCRPSGKRAA